ncbi:MAG TPA: MFS transporter, partial [Alphaproteobacteria bacterium]|nr:MFS transporter [Alphaproteobacteria bacterium]
LFVMPDEPALGITKDKAAHIRVTMCFAALWLLVFSAPLFLFVRSPDPQPRTEPFLAQLRTSVAVAMRIPDMPRFLLARMLFADGLVTLFAFGGIYAAKIFGLTQTMVLVFGIVLNITAGIGAAFGGYADDRFGSTRVIRVSLLALTVLGAVAILAPNQAVFWGAGAALGIFIGPLQSSSRVYVARKAPAEHRASMFGLLMLSGKATSFVGPLLYGIAVASTGTERAGMAIVVILMIAGYVVMPRR